MHNRLSVLVWPMLLFGCVSTAAGEVTRVFDISEHPDRLRRVCLSRGAKFVAALLADEAGSPIVVEIFDLTRRRRIASISDPLRFVDISDQGNRLVSRDDETRIYTIDSQGTVAPLKSLTNVRVFDWDASGNVLACIQVQGDATLATVYRLDTGAIIPLRSTGEWFHTDGLSVSGDGRIVAAVSFGKFRRFDAQSGEQLSAVQLPDPYLQGSVTVSSTGEFAAVVGVWSSEGGPARNDFFVWQHNEPRPLRRFVVDEAVANSIPVISPDGTRVAVMSVVGGPVLLSVRSDIPGDRKRQLLRSSVPGIGDDSQIADFRFCEDSSTIHFVTERGVVYRWKLGAN